MARLLTLAFVLVLALAVAGAALAKGPSAARIEGPGLATPLELTGFGEDGSGPLGLLTSEGGFFVTTFGQTPDPRLPGRPSGDLGPRYGVEYTVPAGETAPSHIAQELYPYAKGGPVLFTPSGQRIFEGSPPSVGGWVQAPASLLDALVAAGLPAGAPGGGSGLSVVEPLPLLAVALAAILVGAALVRRSRTMRTAGA